MSDRVAAIHQPNFLPWLGYFHKMTHADIFILLDDVQYTKGGFINRNRIKTPQGPQWLTVPVVTKGLSQQKILDVKINMNSPWKRKVMGSLAQSYKNAPHFEEFYAQIEAILAREYNLLVDLNIRLLAFVRSILSISTKIIRSSQMSGVQGASTERLISICKSVGATAYNSGAGGRKYQDVGGYKEADLRLLYSDFSPPVYPQLWGDFEPNLSVLDVIFNMGSSAADLLRRIEHGQREASQVTS